MAKIIKNTTQSSKVYSGQTIEAQGQYTIQPHEEGKWANNSTLLTDIGSGAALVNNGTQDITDVNLAINHLKDILATDSDGSPLHRVKVTNSGWHFQIHGIEFTTADRNSIISNDTNNDPLNYATIKLYDSNDNEITTELGELGCVKTVVDWEPTFDYEIIGGNFKIKSALSNDVRLHVIAVPDVPVQYGGSKVFVSNVNLRYVGLEEGVRADGRTAKALIYDNTNHTNKLRIILYHAAGLKVDMHLMIEIFKE